MLSYLNQTEQSRNHQVKKRWWWSNQSITAWFQSYKLSTLQSESLTWNNQVMGTRRSGERREENNHDGKKWRQSEEKSVEEYEYNHAQSKGTPPSMKTFIPTSPMTPENAAEGSSSASLKRIALYKEYCENAQYNANEENIRSDLDNIALPSISPADYRIRQIAYNQSIVHTFLIPGILGGDARSLSWVAPLGAGAVGIVLRPKAADIAVKVSIYETGFDTTCLHPSKAEAQIMKRLYHSLRLSEKNPVTPHVAVILDEIYDISLCRIGIPQHFWESSRSAKELQRWIGRNRNCDLAKCSLLFCERLEGGTLFHSLCRSSPDMKRQRSISLEEISHGVLKTPKSFSQLLYEQGISQVDGIRVLAFQVLFTLAVIKELIPSFKHNDLSLANIMLRATHQSLVDLWEKPHSTVREFRSNSEQLQTWKASPLRVYLYKFHNEKYLVPDLGLQPAIADFDFACIGNGNDPQDVTNAKVHFFETRKPYEEYNINSRQDDIADAQMFLSNLKDVALHNLQNELKARSIFLRASPTKEESNMVEFFHRRVHPKCNDSQNRSLRGRLPPNLQEKSAYYGPTGVLKDPFFDVFRNMSAEYEKYPSKFELLETYGI